MDVFQVQIFILILLLGYSEQALGKEFKPPRIFPEDKEYIIKANDDFVLRCEGKESISWTPPNNTYSDTAEPKYSTIIISSSVTPDSEYTHGSILTIHNASYLDTGFYYCHGATQDFEDISRVSNIYVYVDDPEQLSVIPEYPFAVMVTQHSEAILPCRPTSPLVQVELLQTTGEEDLIGKVFLELPNEDGIIVTYDRRKGFLISEVASDDSILYECQFRRDSVKQNATIFLNVQPITYSIAKPFINELSGGHTIVGERLHLKCTLKVDVKFVMEWVFPDKKGLKSGRIVISKTTKESHDTFYQELTIEKTTLDDEGEYTCVVKDFSHENNNTKFVRIFDKDEHFINLTEENGVYDISVKAGEPSVQWRIDVKAHPLPKLVWYNNKHEEIQAGWSDTKNQLKYEVHTQGSSEAFLKINEITIEDWGYYQLRAINDFEERSLKLFLNVTDKPAVEIQMANFHMINEPNIVKCIVAAYPLPSVFWFYKNCQDDSCDFQPQAPLNNTESQGMLVISYINITAKQSGFIMCSANNSVGTDQSVVGYFVTDVNNGFGIWGLDKDTIEKENGSMRYPIATGETITLYCAASKYNYTDELLWYKKNGSELIVLEDNNYHTIEKSKTEFSSKLTLSFHNTAYGDSGSYACQIKEKPSLNVTFDNITIDVRDPEEPTITETNLNGKELSMNLPDRLELWCKARGVPKPTVNWYKDGKELIETASEATRIKLEHDNRLIFTHTDLNDEGTYACRATNKVGYNQRKMQILFENKPGFDYKYIVIILILVVFFMVALFIVWLRLRKERQLRRELKLAGLANFENGALESINPELGIDDQAELLPYDKKWEFPREKLKLGKQLGSGAFGVVMKAEANGITDGEDTTTVAVKMVKRNADYTYIKALASELKIMVHLGKHLNVVNLLGACTKNVAKRELLVIVEYCRFGNLHNYLLRHRNSFINQIDEKTGKIDYTFGAEILERSFSISSSKSDHNPPPQNMADYRGNFNYTGATACTESTVVSMSPSAGDDSMVTSNSSNSAQPEWRSNYHGDYKGSVRAICTKDLITWAFQVARGMEYLASRRVLHGDLAARNILLSENNIVKICDFGLAKSMYKSDNYKKKGDGPLPVKWMAVESIRDRVFSTQSDIWSYGIVLWEFFSLARTPYPGMEADERLYQKLVDGYRMDAPELATKEIYNMMCECWHPKPLSRPSFTTLAQTIGLMLEESVRQHYVDLNDPYLVMNTQRLEGHSDYLAMLSPPDFEHLSSPHNYVNDEIQPNTVLNPTDTPGYLCMKPSHIFSPRSDDGNVFNFDMDNNARRQKNSSGEIASGTELLPILHTLNESDCETPNSQRNPLSPLTPTSYSNPTYHIPPSISEKTDENIVKSADNYVNMPQSKSAIKNENASVNSNLNPSTKSNYVNSNSRDWESIKV